LPGIGDSRQRSRSALSSSRREASLSFGIWLLACVYSISVCYRWGYGRDAATLTYVLGFPDWVFWGVVAPWSICTLLCFVMAYFAIQDEDLGEAQPEEVLAPSESR
jgi:hypothetical protein